MGLQPTSAVGRRKRLPLALAANSRYVGQTGDQTSVSDNVIAAERESRSVDFKLSFDLNAASDWCEVLKDIVAIANSGGGAILFGVSNDGATPGDASVEKILALDPAVLTDKLNKYTGVQFDDFAIEAARRDGVQIAALRIGCARVPLVFSKPGTYPIADGKQKTAFGVGTLYVRHGAKSEPANTNDLGRIIERRLHDLRKDWMAGVRKVVNAPAGSAVNVLPPATRQSSDPSATPIRITTDPMAPEYRLVDPDATHPYRQKEIISEIGRRLPGVRLNQYHIRAIRQLYGIDSDHGLFHKSRFAPPQYSPKFVDWLCEQHARDPLFFDKTCAEFKRRPREPNDTSS